MNEFRETLMPTPTKMISLTLVAVLILPAPQVIWAQESASSQPILQENANQASSDAEAALTDEELQTLVGPIALYPDTLLIQILVSATVPFDVMKADRFLLENPDAEPLDLSDEIDAQNWDESVEVLALGFPEIIGQMAEHIEWTEALGTAMLAQQEDLLQAVQELREIAQQNGALESNEAVEVAEDEDENIIIVPADPEVVYVPQYQPELVYVSQPRNTVGDAIATGLIIWGTFVVVDAIFGPSYRYWGCRNCCRWSSGRVYNNININIDRNNNIIGNRPGDSWRPRPEQRIEARNRISDRRGPDGATTLPVNRPNRNDDLRRKLSDRTGAPDIADRANWEAPPRVNRGGEGAEALRERSREGQALTRPDRPVTPGARPAEKPSLPTVRPRPESPPSSRPADPSRPSLGQPSTRPSVGQPSSRPGLSQPSTRPSLGQPSTQPSRSRPSTSRAPAAKRSIGSGARAHSARGNASRSGVRANRR